MSQTIKKQIFLWYGANDFEMAATIEQWKEIFEQKYHAINFLIIDPTVYRGGQDFIIDLKNALQVNSLFGSNKLIVLRNFFDKKNSKNIEAEILVEKFLQQVPDNFFLIFSQTDKPDARSKLFKKLTELQKIKQAEIKEFILPQGGALLNWVIKRFGNKNSGIARSAGDLLISMIGNDLWQLETEIDKLASFCRGREVQVKDVQELVNGKYNDDIFALMDAISERDKKKVLLLIDEQLNAGVAEIYLFTMLVRQFRILRQVKELREVMGLSTQEQIAREMKMHPFVVQKTLAQINKFSFDELQKIYNNLLVFEVTIKSKNIDFKVLFDKFIIDL